MGLKTLWLKIKGDNKGLDRSLKKSKGSLNKFGKTVKRIGGMIVAAFALRQIVSFGKEVVGLAAKAEGVRTAFSKLNDPQLLSSLREATRGTVDDLTLMQKAVQAKNFKIPLDQLATYFKFATDRAIETGESVDYLVDSIITGIGRKSVMIMDNLGISAVELQEETQRLGDFGAAAGVIIQRELASAGTVADTTATKIAKINSAWENFKERIGAAIIDSGLLEKALSGVEGVLIDIISLWDKEMADSLKTQEQLLEEANKEYARMEQIQGFISDKTEQINKRRKLGLKPTRAQLNYLERQMGFYDKHKARIEEILALLKEVKKTGDPVVTDPPAPATRDTAPDPMTPRGVDVGAVPIDTTQLAETGYYSGVEYSKAFTAAAKEQFARWEALDTLKAALQESAALIVDSVEMIFESIGSDSFDNLGKDLLTRFADFLSQLGKLMVAYGMAMLMFSILSKSPDPISAGLAIGAGVAAIAIAGLIRGAVSGAGDSMGGGGGSYGGGYRSSTSGSLQPLENSIQIQGTLKGSDIEIASRRYTEKRNTTT